MAERSVLVETAGGIGTIKLNRPETLNAFDTKLIADTFCAIEELGSDSSVKVVVITGVGKTFSAGADIKGRFLANIEKRKSGDLNIALRESNLAAGLHSMMNLGKPLIAAVNGLAIGLGCTISLACDMRIASEDARFGFGFVKMALTPEFGSSYFLPRLIGVGRTLELLYSGRLLGAQEAKDMGMVNNVVPLEKLPAAVDTLARNLAQGPSISLKLIREGIYQGMQVDLDTALKWEYFALNTCFSTDDHEEAVRAFVEKRQPTFRGR